MRGNSTGSIIKTIVLVAILVAVFTVPPVRDLPPVKAARGAAIFVVYPFQYIAYKGFTGTHYLIKSILTLRSAQKENDALRQKLYTERSINNVFEQLAAENKYLRSQLSFKRENPYHLGLLPAEVVARSPSSWFRIVEIDKGFRSGVRMGAAVLDSFGLVGRIVEVSNNSSKILLITDENSSVSVIVKRTSEIGVLLGGGSGNLVLKYIHSSSDIREGDLIVSSGISDFFPKGIPVGRVLSIGKKDYDLFQSITVKSIVDFSRLDSVFVVK